MSVSIPFDLDSYGGYARVSALADYVEIATIDDVSLTRAGLADRLGDVGARRLRDMFTEEGSPAEDNQDDLEPSENESDESSATGEDAGTRVAGRVFDMLAEREQTLGDLYPFTVGEDVIALDSNVDLDTSIYVAVLSISLAHANGIACDVDPKQVLEATVARALRATGVVSVDVGALSRTPGHDFRTTVKQAGVALGLTATPLAATTFANANEEGVDCIGYLSAGTPRRAGAWTLLGQVTCGRSETWQGKMDEPKPLLWKKLLGTGISPLAFLAVPHHVDSVHLTKLLQDADRVVLDRLRLVELAGAPSEDEAKIMAAVRAVGVEKIV